jgi:hypothetical protein
MLDGPVFTAVISAVRVTGVLTVLVSSVGVGSGVGLVTVAVFVIGPVTPAPTR